MSKYLILLIVGLCSIDNVFSLECYASDLGSVIQGTAKNFTHELQDCTDYLNSVLKLMGYSARRFTTQIPMSCFTVLVETDEGNFVTKGCLANGRCDIMKNSVRQSITLGGKSDALRDVTCTTCSTNGCNKPDSHGLR